ncbi:flagellar export protein FliJ [Aquabacterium sp.]|uniref:flagellar export protein FliJ n=1 Tax=Aquabacterium sp. TaxID=1872578 RepID=UPI0035AE31AC
MSALKPLISLLEVAERERDEAVTRHERLRQAAQAAQDQGDSLRAWRGDYAARWQTQFQSGSSVEIMRCYQEFMSRLGQAIAEQDIAIERTRNSLEAARMVLQAREQRVAAVSQLIDRRRREQSLAESRREQKATDEQAARMPQRGRSAGGLASFGAFGSSQPGALDAPGHTDFEHTLN